MGQSKEFKQRIKKAEKIAKLLMNNDKRVYSLLRMPINPVYKNVKSF